MRTDEKIAEHRRREALRYLGYGSSKPDTHVEKLLEESFAELDRAVRVRSYYKIYDLEMTEEDIFCIGGFIFKSHSLYRNLKDCTRIAVFGITLGTATDMLIRRYEILDMAHAVVLQATATAFLEEKCDALQDTITAEAHREGLWTRPRFSPGYGDFDLSYQGEVSKLLDLPRKAGITVTESFMMAPVKSVTAFIGMSRESSGCIPEGCEICDKKDCRYRRGNG